MDSNPIIQKKQLSIKYAGSMQKYEQFKKMMGASPLLYSHDFHFYNDDITTRHQRNAKELQLLRKLLKEGKIETNMLSFNVFNTYYPSYVLHHHYEVFVPILSMFSEREDIKRILTCSRRHVFTGAFFYEKIKLNLKEADKNTPTIDASGVIQMPEDTYFYSGVTSPYITHCAFIAHHESGPRLVVVALRDSEGAFSAGVKVRDLGATTSDDYLSIGYNLTGIKPAALIQLTPQIGKKLFSIGMKQRFYEFSYSLKDLQKSLWITVNYTNMRKQFKTIDQSKEERRIITYQAVATRIINGFAQYIAFTDMYSRVVEEGRSHVVLSEILESSHHIILENLIHLRQCCGGFGYMQVSGHPGCIERVCFRAGQEKNKDMKLTPEYLQATQYYASTEESEKYYCQPITAEKPTYMNYFGIFLSIIFNMRRNKGNLSSLQFKREYLRQSSLIAMHAREEFSRSDASNIHCQLLQYAISTYILKNVGFISWELIKIERTAFIDRLEQFRNGFLQFISQNLLSLGETLELSFLRNTIVGRQKSDQFYNQVLTTSKNNLRNDPQYLKEIQAPIIEMITTNRAKL